MKITLLYYTFKEKIIMAKVLSKEEALIELLKKRKTIVLKAKYGKQQGVLTICPVKDPVTGELRGVKNLSEEEKKKEKRPVDEYTTRKIMNDMSINYDNVIDRTDWDWIVFNKEISPSREDSNSSEVVLFYVDDYEGEIEKTVKKRELIIDAEIEVRNASEAKKAEVCRLLGVDAKYMSPTEIAEFLYSKSSSHPELLINKFKDPDAKAKILVMDLMDRKIITEDQETGTYIYGTTRLGSKKESVVAWISDKSNSDIVIEMRKDLLPL